MQLCDKWLSMAPKADQQEAREHLAEGAVFNAEAVARHYYLSPTMTFDNSIDFPYARPSFNSGLLQFNSPPYALMGNELVEQPRSQGGVLFRVHPFDKAARKSFLELAKESPPPRDGGNPVDAANRAAIIVKTRQAVFTHHRLVIFPGHGTWLMTEEGEVLFSAVTPESPEDAWKLQRANALGMFPEIGLWHIAWLTFSFMNCRNVELVDKTAELQPEEKIRRRLKIPEIKRYVLSIDGHVDRVRREFCPADDGESSMPWHLCRGSFATYTADKPLFGNPKLVGRFWRPPHAKGERKNGEIVKAYAVGSGELQSQK